MCSASSRLRETEPSAALQALADACVEQLDRFRAPPSDAELARRRRASLTPRQDAMLVRWGYPYVFDTWFFHMTLTRRLTPGRSGSSCLRPRPLCARDCDATPGQRHLPVRAARAGRAVRHRGAADAARLSAARKRATPSSSDASFTTVSTGTSVRQRDAARQPRGDIGCILAPARRQPRSEHLGGRRHLDDPYGKRARRLGDDRCAKHWPRRRRDPRPRRPGCRSAAHAPATAMRSRARRIPPRSPLRAPRRPHRRAG